MKKQLVFIAITALAMVASGATAANAGMLLVSERNASTIHEWEPSTGATAVFHSQLANDADYSSTEGSAFAWLPEHGNDHFGRFVPGSGTGLDQQYDLGVGGRTHYSYPKHITVFNSNIVVMSRNNATIYWYDETGNELGSNATGNGTGQGMATNGTDLYASFWDGANSFFQRYDSSFVAQGATISSPTGMGANNNIFDFAYDPVSQHYFGLARAGENGTTTDTNTVFEFEMGGAVIATYTLPFQADGIGQNDNLTAGTPPGPGADDDPLCGNLIPVGGPHAAWAMAIVPLMLLGIWLVRRRVS